MTYPLDPTTVLAISGIYVPPYSARGIRQTLRPIAAAADMYRTVNGELVDVSQSQLRKYSSVITCTDQQHPALNGVWPGDQVVVDCVCELAYDTATGTPERTEVPGSSRVEGDFTFYRPRLTMRVVDYDVAVDEYAADVAWSLTLEEV